MKYIHATFTRANLLRILILVHMSSLDYILYKVILRFLIFKYDSVIYCWRAQSSFHSTFASMTKFRNLFSDLFIKKKISFSHNQKRIISDLSSIYKMIYNNCNVDRNLKKKQSSFYKKNQLKYF